MLRPFVEMLLCVCCACLNLFGEFAVMIFAVYAAKCGGVGSVKDWSMVFLI